MPSFERAIFSDAVLEIFKQGKKWVEKLGGICVCNCFFFMSFAFHTHLECK